jgi:hypothetical protein
VAALFAITDARPANAASYNYWMYVFSGARYLSAGVDKACVYQGYNASHNGVDLHNQSTCSSTSGAGVAMRTTGNTTDPSGGAQINASVSVAPLTVQASSTCTLHYIHLTVKKPYSGGQTAWIERFMHTSRSDTITIYVGFGYSQYDGGAWATNVTTVGSMHDEGSGCNPKYWTGYHLHQQRYSLGSGVTGYRNPWFDIECCSVNNFKVWLQHRELFLWTRTV